MKLAARFHPKSGPKEKLTLKRKLFGYMFILAVLLLLLLLTSMFLIGAFTGTKQRISDVLQFQSAIFERQLNTYYDGLAVMSVQLSQSSTALIDAYLQEQDIAFSALNDAEQHIAQLQEILIQTLRYKLWEADCTGAFILLDAQVNSNADNAATSRTGIYLQRNSLESSDSQVLLYRGLAQVGKNYQCMPHRKWRLEFSTDLFPNYTERVAEINRPLKFNCRTTDIVKLPGTDQHVMLMTVPVMGKDGTFYGICGFEINEGYFKQTFTQPSELDRAVFCLSNGKDGLHIAERTLSAGILNQYYLEPSGTFTASDFGNGLTCYTGDTASYIGLTKEIVLCSGDAPSSLSVLIPKQDYDRMAANNRLRIILLIAVFAVIAFNLAWLFTRRYLDPIKKNIEQIRLKEYTDHTAYAAEIDDLFAFLAEQDRQNEAALAKAEAEKDEALITIAQMQQKYEEANKVVERLVDTKKDDIKPEDYEHFKNGLETLTEKEREIFNLYLSGKTAKEITALINIKESTLKFHNHNMLGKLGVSSRKQMLHFATLMQEDGIL